MPISARLAYELKKLWQNRLTVNQSSVFGIAQSVAKAWKTVTRQANVLEIRFHDLRHTFASRMTEEGINPLVTALVMGHSAGQFSAMTLHYTHLTPKMAEQVLVALAAIEDRRIQQAQGVSTSCPQTAASRAGS